VSHTAAQTGLILSSLQFTLGRPALQGSDATAVMLHLDYAAHLCVW
jgi:hypothetical protein